MLEDYLAIINNDNCRNKPSQSISDTIEDNHKCNNDNDHKPKVAYFYLKA